MKKGVLWLGRGDLKRCLRDEGKMKLQNQGVSSVNFRKKQATSAKGGSCTKKSPKESAFFKQSPSSKRMVTSFGNLERIHL